MDVSVIIPMRDEKEGLPALFDAFERLQDLLTPRRAIEFVLVDDGSTDGTFDDAWPRADKVVYPIKVIRVNPGEGIGAAIRHGIDFAIGSILITYDADLPYPLEDFERLLDALDDGADVATASPYHPDGAVDGVTGWRLFLSKAASRVYRLRLGKRGRGLHTFTCGFRAYRRDVIASGAPRHDGFLATAELLVDALRDGRRVAEVPSVLSRRRTGRSKMRVLRTSLAHLRYLVTLR